MLEVTPPLKRASKENVKNTVESIATIVNELNIDFVNIPEIVMENHKGEPLYKNIDTRDFAILIKDATKAKVAINKVTVYSPEKEFDKWLDDTLDNYGINHLIFVGGNKANGYPGISVIDANTNAINRNVKVGNILIPNRQNELEKLISKTEKGASFFTTQILFEENIITALLLQYVKLCKEKSIKPAEIFIGVAPMRDEMDLEFIKWLGVEIPEKIEQRLKVNYSDSINIANEIYNNASQKSNLPLSLNVEPLTTHNLPLAKEIIQKCIRSIS